MKRKFSVREKALLLLLALLLLGAFYIFLVLKPVQETIAAASLRQEQAESGQTLGTAKLAKMRRMEQALAGLLPDAREDVPDYDNAQNVANLLHDALSKADTYELTFRPVEFDGRIARRRVELSWTCASYETAKAILFALEEGAFRCEITGLTMTEQDKLSEGEIPSLQSGSVGVKASACFYEFLPEEANGAESTEK